MKIFFAATLLLFTLASPSLAADHPCADDAKARALGLLKLHFLANSAEEASDFSALASKTLENAGIDDAVVVLPPVRALVGEGKFDVLETSGGIYKASYRMRMIYAQIPGSCILMGQEILEASNPY